MEMQCNECLSLDSEIEGWGVDEHGEYTEFRCVDCGRTTKQWSNDILDNEE